MRRRHPGWLEKRHDCERDCLRINCRIIQKRVVALRTKTMSAGFIRLDRTACTPPAQELETRQMFSHMTQQRGHPISCCGPRDNARDKGEKNMNSE